MLPSRPNLIACLLTLVAMLLASCTAARVDRPLTRDLRPAETLEFWHTLPTRPLACNDEAFHAILLWADGKDEATAYDQRVQSLKKRAWLAGSFSEPAQSAAHRGTYAVAAAGALGLKGGITMQIFGPSPRYALREMEYRGLMPPGSENQAITGADLVGLIARAQEFRDQNKLEDTEAVASAASRCSSDPFTPDRRPSFFCGFDPLPAALRSLPVASVDPPTVVWPIFALAEAAPSTSPSTLPADNLIRAVVVKVEGDAQYRESPASDWKPLVSDPRTSVILTQSASIRTGATARVTLRAGADQEIVVGHLTTITLLRAVREKNAVKVDVGMDYGRALLDVYQHQVDHQTTITSPNAVLAIRGTRVILTDHAPFPAEAMSITGRAQFAAARKAPIPLGSPGGGKAKVTIDQANPAEAALAAATVDPTLSTARTESETRFVQTVLAQGAVLTRDPLTGIPIVRGGVPPTGSALRSILPGPLSIVVTWTGNANLDLGVTTPDHEFVYPAANLTRSPSGATTAFDHRGGPHGGIEVVYYPKNNYPDGTYLVGVKYVSGSPARATIQVFENGQSVPVTTSKVQPLDVNRTTDAAARFRIDPFGPFIKRK